MKRAIAIVFGLALLAPLARADKPRCRLERIDPAQLGDDKLRVYASAVELEGTVVEGMLGSQFQLKIDKKSVGKAEKVQLFEAAKEEVDVALVVEVAAQYKKALERVSEALREFLEEQPTSMKVSLITFGSDIERKTPKPITARSMGAEVENLSPDDDSADVRLADAVRMGLGELKKVEVKEEGQTPPRKIIVLISDGLNAKMDRPTFKKLGDEAARAGVPIHSIAFSPIDERGPLLNLGELSKRTNGTFRWAKTADDLPEQLKNLGEEVRKQYVLTFKVPISSMEKHNFQLQCGQEMVSNVLKDGQAGIMATASTGTRWYWWVLYIVGGLIGLYLLLAIGLFVKQKLSQPRGEGVPAAARVKAAIKPTGGARVVGGGMAAGGAPAARGGRAGTLVGVTGTLAGKRFPVGGGLTLGKGAGHGITVPGDPSVSTNHCEIRHDGQGYVIRDLGSTNGTFVNGRKLAGPQRINDGDLIRCGSDTQFKLRMD
jgi:FHA domain/von Willebrand factor type A domain